MLDLSIIIVSHGHDALLGMAITAMVPALDGVSAEVILVDNLGHADFGKDIPRQPFEVRILSNPQAAGLSRNTNQAATMARGQFLLMMNPDTEYHAGKIADAIAYMRQHADAGALGCRLLYPDGSLQQTYRQFPIVPVIFIRGLYASRWPTQPAFYRRSLMQDVKLDRPTPVDWMLGAWLLMRREDFFAMRGLDERFFLYYEDIDLCYRITSGANPPSISPTWFFITGTTGAAPKRRSVRLGRCMPRASPNISGSTGISSTPDTKPPMPSAVFHAVR